ncbi:MAG: SDR family NAD(P)-dependent oxidoreductase, partial [Nakamurella sp.]
MARSRVQNPIPQRGRPRVAIVTGAGSGIGAATALALAGDGWQVLLAGRRQAALADVAEQGKGLSGGLVPVPTDVTDEDSVVALFGRARAEFSGLDLLFNNAGMFSLEKEPDAITLAEWTAIV